MASPAEGWMQRIHMNPLASTKAQTNKRRNLKLFFSKAHIVGPHHIYIEVLFSNFVGQGIYSCIDLHWFYMFLSTMLPLPLYQIASLQDGPPRLQPPVSTAARRMTALPGWKGGACLADCNVHVSTGFNVLTNMLINLLQHVSICFNRAYCFHVLQTWKPYSENTVWRPAVEKQQPLGFICREACGRLCADGGPQADGGWESFFLSLAPWFETNTIHNACGPNIMKSYTWHPTTIILLRHGEEELVPFNGWVNIYFD